MILNAQLVTALLVVGLIALASRQIGDFFSRIHLPLVTGFLLTGMMAGPYVLDIVSAGTLVRVQFLDEVALGFIGFAAGMELHLSEFRSRFRIIGWVTLSLVASTFVIAVVAIVLLSDAIPFMEMMPVTERLAVALLAGAILVARSPSSAMAVINELRARGPFTRLALAVTVATDVVVIVLFAISSSLADALLSELGLLFGVALLVMA